MKNKKRAKGTTNSNKGGVSPEKKKVESNKVSSSSTSEISKATEQEKKLESIKQCFSQCKAKIETCKTEKVAENKAELNKQNKQCNENSRFPGTNSQTFQHGNLGLEIAIEDDKGPLPTPCQKAVIQKTVTYTSIMSGHEPCIDSIEQLGRLITTNKNGGHEGMLPISVTAVIDDVEKVKHYFSRNPDTGQSLCDPNFRCLNDGSTPLHLAIRSKQVDTIKVLLENGADCCLTDYVGDNALMAAIKCGDANVINAIWPYRKNLNVDHANVLGMTALHYGAERKWECLINFLLQNKADTNRQSTTGVTPLMMAATKDIKTVELLVKAGADILTEDHDGNTCICKSFVENKKDITRFLLKSIPEEKRDIFIKTRLDLVLNPPNPDDERKLLETCYLPILEECTARPEFRNAFYNQRAVHKLTLKMEDHMHNLEIAMFASQLIFAIMFRFGDEIDTKFVKQFLNCKGPDLTIHMTKFYTEVWKMTERSTIVVFLPMIGLSEVPEGRAWLKKNYVSVSEYINFFIKDNLKQYISPNPEYHWCLECQHFRKILDVWHNFHDIMNDIQTEQRVKHMVELLEEEEREKARQIKRKEKKKIKRQVKKFDETEEVEPEVPMNNEPSSPVTEVLQIDEPVPCTNDNANAGADDNEKSKKGRKKNMKVKATKSLNQVPATSSAAQSSDVMVIENQQDLILMSQNSNQWKTVHAKRHPIKEKEKQALEKPESDNISKKRFELGRKSPRKKYGKHNQTSMQQPQTNTVANSGSTRWADIAKGISKKPDIVEVETELNEIQEEQVPVYSPEKASFVETDFPSLAIPPKMSVQQNTKPKRSGTYTFHFHEQQQRESGESENDYIVSSQQELIPHDHLVIENIVYDQENVSRPSYLKQDCGQTTRETDHELAASSVLDANRTHMVPADGRVLKHESKLKEQYSDGYSHANATSGPIQQYKVHPHPVIGQSERIKAEKEYVCNPNTEVTVPNIEQTHATSHNETGIGNMDGSLQNIESKVADCSLGKYQNENNIAYVGPDECQINLETIIKHQNKAFPKFQNRILLQRIDDPFIDLPTQNHVNPVDALFATTEEIPSWFNDVEQHDEDQYWIETDKFATELNNEIASEMKETQAYNSNVIAPEDTHACDPLIQDDIVSTDPAIIGYSNMQRLNQHVSKQTGPDRSAETDSNGNFVDAIRPPLKSNHLGNEIANNSENAWTIRDNTEFTPTAKNCTNRQREFYEEQLIQDCDTLEKQTAVIKPLQNSANQPFATPVVNSAFGQNLLDNACRLEREHADDDDSILYPENIDGQLLDKEKSKEEHLHREIADTFYFPSFHSNTKLSSDFDERDVSIFHRMQQIQLQQINNYYNQYSKQITNNMSMHQNNFMYYATCAGMNKQQIEQYLHASEQHQHGKKPVILSSDTSPNMKYRNFDNVPTNLQKQETTQCELPNNTTLLPCIQNLTPRINVTQEAPSTIKESPATEGLNWKAASPELTATSPSSCHLQNVSPQPGYPQSRLHPANIHMIQATQAAMAASVMNQIKDMYKTMLKAKMRSVRWKNELLQLRNLPTDKQIVLGKIVIPKDESDRIYISHHSSGAIVLGFLNDGTEVAVKIMNWKTRDFSLEELQHLVDLDVSKYFMNKYKTFCSLDGFYYIAMELYEYTLDEYLQKLLMGDDVVETVVYNKLVWQFLRGLASLHQHCLMIHGELKPDNLVIDVDGNVRIVGYGLSRNTNRDILFVDYSDEDKCWLSPEVLVHQQKVTFKSDIWVAGMLIYYILSGGKNPFGAETEGIVWNISQQAYAMDYISEEAGHLLSLMLSVNKSERPCISDALRHPYFWSEEKRLRFVLIAGSDVLRDKKAGIPMDGSGRKKESMISIIGSMPCNIKIINWLPEIETAVIREMKSFRQYKNNVVELVLFVYNCCLHFEKMSETAKEIIDEPCKYFLTKFPTLFMTVYRAIKMTNRTERTCYKPFF